MSVIFRCSYNWSVLLVRILVVLGILAALLMLMIMLKHDSVSNSEVIIKRHLLIYRLNLGFSTIDSWFVFWSENQSNDKHRILFNDEVQECVIEDLSQTINATYALQKLNLRAPCQTTVNNMARYLSFVNNSLHDIFMLKKKIECKYRKDIGWHLSDFCRDLFNDHRHAPLRTVDTDLSLKEKDLKENILTVKGEIQKMVKDNCGTVSEDLKQSDWVEVHNQFIIEELNLNLTIIQIWFYPIFYHFTLIDFSRAQWVNMALENYRNLLFLTKNGAQNLTHHPCQDKVSIIGSLLTQSYDKALKLENAIGYLLRSYNTWKMSRNNLAHWAAGEDASITITKVMLKELKETLSDIKLMTKKLMDNQC